MESCGILNSLWFSRTRDACLSVSAESNTPLLSFCLLLLLFHLLLQHKSECQITVSPAVLLYQLPFMTHSTHTNYLQMPVTNYWLFMPLEGATGIMMWKSEKDSEWICVSPLLLITGERLVIVIPFFIGEKIRFEGNQNKNSLKCLRDEILKFTSKKIRLRYRKRNEFR